MLYPFLVIDQLGEYDVSARVKGGGTTGEGIERTIELHNIVQYFNQSYFSAGQAGALRLDVSKALLAFPGNHGNQLEERGYW